MNDRRSRAVVLAGSAMWCLLIIAAPAFDMPTIYRFFSIVCHQDPHRSWYLAGEPLAVCIRCTCIYLGFFIGTLLSLEPNTAHLRLAALLTIGEFILARLVLDSAWLRAATGLFLGIATAPFVVAGIHQMLQTRFRREAV